MRRKKRDLIFIPAINIFITVTEALVAPAQKNTSLLCSAVVDMHTGYYRGSPIATYAGMTSRSHPIN